METEEIDEDIETTDVLEEEAFEESQEVSQVKSVWEQSDSEPDQRKDPLLGGMRSSESDSDSN